MKNAMNKQFAQQNSQLADIKCKVFSAIEEEKEARKSIINELIQQQSSNLEEGIKSLLKSEFAGITSAIENTSRASEAPAVRPIAIFQVGHNKLKQIL